MRRGIRVDPATIDQKIKVRRGDTAAIKGWWLNEHGTLGLMAKIYVLAQACAVHEHLGCSKAEFAERLCSKALERDDLPEGVSKTDFKDEIERWCIPSKPPYRKIIEYRDIRQTIDTAAFLLAREYFDFNFQEKWHIDWRSGIKLFEEINNNAISSDNKSSNIDKYLLKKRPLLKHITQVFVDNIVNHLAVAELPRAPIIVAGEIFSGKKTFITHIIDQLSSTDIPKRIKAVRCAHIRYETFVQHIYEFLTEGDYDQNHSNLSVEDMAKKIETYALEIPAIYIFSDLDLINYNLSNSIDENNNFQLMIDLLIESNKKTRMIVTTTIIPEHFDHFNKHPKCIAIDGEEILPSLIGWQIYFFPTPQIDDLEEIIDDSDFRPIVSKFRQKHSEYDGEAVALLLILFNTLKTKKLLLQKIGIIDATIFLDKRPLSNKKMKMEIFRIFWSVFSDIEKDVITILSIAEDGVRDSTIRTILSNYNADIDVNLENLFVELSACFGLHFHRSFSERSASMDCLNERTESEYISEFEFTTRRIILPWIEGENNERARFFQRAVAYEARSQAYCRRLNTERSYGNKMSDVYRDIQAILGLLASVDPDKIGDHKEQSSRLRVSTERTIFCNPECDPRDVIRYAYLEIFKTDIDTDHRIDREYSAHYLTIHIILAMLTSLGRNYWPHPNPKLEDVGFNKIEHVFNQNELIRIFIDLGIASHKVGANDLLKYALESARKLQPTSKAMAPLIRAHIDTAIFCGRLYDNVDVEGGGFLGILNYTDKMIDELSKETRGDDVNIVKMNMRKAELLYLVGRRSEATAIYEEMYDLEMKSLDDAGSFVTAGRGGRRWLRLLMGNVWILLEKNGQANDHNIEKAENTLRQAYEIHTLALRRLSKFPTARTGLLYDEARLTFLKGCISRAKGQTEEEMRLFELTRQLFRRIRTHAFALGPSLHTRLDIDGMIARTNLQLLRYSSGSSQVASAARDECLQAIQRLERTAKANHAKWHGIYARLLRFRYEEQLPEDLRNQTFNWKKELQKLKKESEQIHLKWYKNEIEECIASLKH